MKKETMKLAAIGVVIFAAGFLGGMEYKAYQIRSVVDEAFSGLFEEDDEHETASAEQNEEAAATNDLTKKVGFRVTEKRFVEGDFADSNHFTFEFTNNTEKDIEGVKGSVIFKDLFDDQIKHVTLSYDEGIPAGESTLYRASIDYNQFMDSDIELRNIELAKMKYDWVVDTIIYTDGTRETY